MKKIKYQVILHDLMDALRNGEIASEGRLPSERALAGKYGVTRATARRALIHLTEMRLVQRHGPHGTSVSPGRIGEQAVTVSLVCPEGMSAVVEEFIRCGIGEAARRRWGHRIIRAEFNNEASVAYPLSLGNPCLLLGEPMDFRPAGKLETVLKAAAGRCVVVGTRMDYAGIPSVISDDMKGITLAMNRFLKMGHEKVAFICGPEPLDHPMLSVQLHTWRRCMLNTMDEADLKNSLVRVDTTEPFACTETASYKAVSRFLASPKSAQVTGLFCQTEEYASGAVAACRDAGRAVPESMSLIQMGVSRRAALGFPPRDLVDVHIDQHVQLAVEMIEQTLTGQFDGSNPLRVVTPTFLKQSSVSCRKA
jgi:DNA-binding transcriptional regulator YhcF (GntR family)